MNKMGLLHLEECPTHNKDISVNVSSLPPLSLLWKHCGEMRPGHQEHFIGLDTPSFLESDPAENH